MVWPDCDFLNGEWSRGRKTSYWVRVAESEIPDVLASAAHPGDLAGQIAGATEAGVVHVLVSEDLDSIVALPGYYPDAGQWNGMSPFVPLDPWRIDHLAELADGPPTA